MISEVLTVCQELVLTAVLLKTWIHKIGQENLPMNANTSRVGFVVITLFQQRSGSCDQTDITRDSLEIPLWPSRNLVNLRMYVEGF